MFRQKAVAVALVLFLAFNVLAGLVGELSFDSSEENNAGYSPHDLEPFLEKQRETRAGESQNVDMLSRILYGPAMDIETSGNYAYVCAGFNLMVFDITDKADPQPVGDTWTYFTPVAIDVEGSFAYIADFAYGLLIFDISNPASPQRVGGYRIQEGFLAWDVKVSGTHAYLARFDMGDFSNPDNGLVAIDISSKSDPQLDGGYYGYVIPGLDATGSTVYAACLADGLRIVDMSTPSSPVGLGFNSTILAFNVDVFGDTAYVVDFGSSMWPVDVTDASNPEVLSHYPADDPKSVHVDLANNIACLANGMSGLTLLDVGDPSSPVELDSVAVGGNVNGIFQEGTHAFVAGTTAGLVIVDITNPMNSVIEGSYFTGGITSEVVVSDGVAYVADEAAELIMYDISDPTNPISLGATANDIGADGVEVWGDYAYVVDGDEFLVYNIANPANPTQTGSTWLLGFYEDMYLEYPYVYVATGEDGVSIVDVSTPSSPNEVNVYSQVTEALGVHVSKGYLFIADGNNGLRIASLTNPENPGTPVTSPTGDTAMDVFVHGDYAYVAINDSGLRIVEVTNPVSPQPRATADTNGISAGVFVTGGHAYVADGSEGLIVIDVTDALDPNWAGFYNTSGLAEEVYVHGDTAYVSTLGGGLYILDVSQLSFPEVETVFPEPDVTDVSSDTNIIINFTKGMDTTSTQNAFSYTDGSQTWMISDGTVVWTNQDKSLTFTPFSDLIYDSVYEVTISQTATDKDGNFLPGDFTWSFSTAEAPPQVVSHQPDDNALNVAVDEEIIINFSKAMDRISVEVAFAFSDGVSQWSAADGSITWGNGDKSFIFAPNGGLINGAEYEVTLSHTATGANGLQMDTDGDGTPGEVVEDDFIFTFTVIPLPPEVNSTYPLDGTTLVSIATSVVINFTKGMNRVETLAALEYSDGSSTSSPSASQVAWSNGNRTMTFKPATNFANEKTYTFTVHSTAMGGEGAYLDSDGDGTGGEEGEDDYSFSFSTMHLPSKVIQTTPGKKETKVEVGTDIIVRFSRAMETGSVEAAFSYTNDNTTTVWKASDGVVQWSQDSKIMTFTPDELLEHDRVYTVTILASANDTLGVTLDGDKDKIPEGVGIDDYTWDFTTIMEPPEVLSLEPGNNTVDVFVDIVMKIRFDRSMNTRSVEQAFSFTHSETSETWEITDGTAVWTESDSVMTFTPDFKLDEGVKYTVTVEDSAEDEDGVEFPGLEWHFTTKLNSEPVLENGGVNPDPGTSDDQFTFSIVYTDADNDEPTETILVVDQVEWKMTGSDRTDDTFNDGKVYEFIISLDEGDHEYYFEFSDEKHTVRFPAGSATKKLKVEAAEEDGEGTGFLDQEYAGIPGMVCLPIGLIIIVVIILVAVLMVRRGRRAGGPEESTMSFQSFEPETSFQTFDDSGSPPLMFQLPADEPVMSFAPMEEEPGMMSFTAFEEPSPALAAAQPAVVQCPDCGEYLRVRAAHRPFQFPCKCGAKLVLK